MFKKVLKPREEEWVWVDGFKGTDKDMKCNDYQYEMGKQHDMPEGEEIVECKSGFHLCRELMDVFHYYPIGDGRRFFKVRALVRKKDWENEYVSCSDCDWSHAIRRDKLTSKSIIFERELTPDEIITDRMIAYSKVRSEEFARYILTIDKFQMARALGSQKDISMDTRVNHILKDANTN